MGGAGLSLAQANLVAGAYAAQLPAVPVNYTSTNPQEIETTALFADGSFALTDQLSLLAGFRWDNESNKTGASQIATFAGRFPTWLAPIQAIVLPISDRHNPYAGRALEELREAGVRVAVDDRSESVGKKIRDASAIGRYPYMLVVGDREEETGSVAVRSHTEGDLGAMSLAEFADRVKTETGVE